MKLHQELKKARQESRYPNLRDFAEQCGLSYGGYKKLETGERVPEAETLETIIRHGDIHPTVAEQLRELRMRTHAKRSGLPAIKSVDVDQIINHLESAFIVILKNAGVNDVARLASIYKKRAAIIVKAALED